jgi:hypothetical protein
LLFALFLAWAVSPAQEAAPAPAKSSHLEQLESQAGLQAELRARDDAELLVVPGQLPLVISAPHGGGLRPMAWPVREGGVQVRDTNTYPIALALGEAIRRRTGQTPSLIASRVHRRHLDLNRDAKESGAELGEPQRSLWQDYHGGIEQACRLAQRQGGGRALLIDLHGHGHEHGLIELGFAVSAENLRKSDAELSDSSWIRGPMSLGAELDRRGWKSVPSPSQPAPELGQDYFNGGYTVRRHQGEGLRSIQVELPPRPRRLQAEQRQALVEDLADAILAVLIREVGISSLPLGVVPSSELILWGPAELAWEPAQARSLQVFSDQLPRAVDVFGIPVLATAEVSELELQTAAASLARRLDADADGRIDDLANALELQRAGYAVILFGRRFPQLPDSADRGDWRTLTVAHFERFEQQLDPRVPRKAAD